MADQLSSDQLAEVKSMFSMFDKNGDQTISTDELKTVMQALGQNPTDEDVKEMIKSLDENGNGSVEFDEFVKYFAKNKKDSSELDDELRDAFKKFDKDGNGYVSKDELIKVLRECNCISSDEEGTAMFEELDTNSDGKISYEEAVAAWRK